ncbi:hypothetical protein [Mycoplasma sp. ATU-Cv-508]|uniref:hypothetical protein n=1 Tax=Mycoplasma sp. ATU-Cv-508 TaxID=2048001 RepID=UPI001374E8DB
MRLFETVDDPKDHHLENQIRRQKRSARRLKNRRKNLKLDYIKLLKKTRTDWLRNWRDGSREKVSLRFVNKYIVDKVEEKDFQGLDLSAEQKGSSKLLGWWFCVSAL